MRLIYFGSGEFGIPTLARLHESHEIVGVVTQLDRPAGRDRQMTPTAIAAWGIGHQIEVLRTADANSRESVERVGSWKPDASVVIAFGQKLSPLLIEVCGGLAINLHASLLPKYRGAAPINWAIINGEAETGLSVIGLSQRMDAGLVYGQVSTPIGPTETAGELHDRLSQMGPGLVCGVLGDFQRGVLKGVAQADAVATKAPKLSKSDGWLDWDDEPVRVCRRVHGLTPWPGVSVVSKGRDDSRREVGMILRRLGAVEGRLEGVMPGTIVEQFHVVVKGGLVRLLEVQPPGGRTMTVEEYSRGHALVAGDRLEPVMARAGGVSDR
jgi:methionyl-tRNA formyltransferase